MFGSKLIEKLINDTSISVNVESRQYHVLLNEETPLFHICKDSYKIQLTKHTWDLMVQTEESLCGVLLCTYLKLNYLLQHGYMKLFIDGNMDKTEALSMTKIQNCLNFFEELKGEKATNLNEQQLKAISTYGLKMHESFIRV